MNEKGISQSALAERVNAKYGTNLVQPNVARTLADGSPTPSFERIEQLAYGVGLTLEELFSGKEMRVVPDDEELADLTARLRQLSDAERESLGNMIDMLLAKKDGRRKSRA